MLLSLCKSSRALCGALAVFALTTCGGGGAELSPPPPVVVLPDVVLKGTVAVGAPVVGASVNVVCAGGGAVAPVTTGAVGTWSASLSGQTFPCAVQVANGKIGNGTLSQLKYHAVAVKAGTVNVTPLTDLMVASTAATATPSAWFDGLSTSKAALAAIDQTKLDASLNQLKVTLPAPNGVAAINPVTSDFVRVAGDPMDDWLTSLQNALEINVTGVRYEVLLANLAASQTPDQRFLTALADPTCASPKAATATGALAGSLVLNASRTTGVAPLAVSFEAYDLVGTTTSLDPAKVKAFHEIKYLWDFGDPACGATWSHGTKADVARKNNAYGPVAAHVFETPGVYTVTLSGFDGADINYKTVTVTVTDPDTVFAASTLCVSNASLPVAGQNECPKGAAVFQTNKWTEVVSKTNVTSALYKRILLKRGERWSTDGIATIKGVGPGLIGAYGVGKNPIISIDFNAPALLLAGTDWRFKDLEITTNRSLNGRKSDINVDSGLNKYFCHSSLHQETTYPNFTYDENKISFSSTGGGNHLLLNLYIHDVHVGLNVSSSTGIYVVDTVVEDLFDGNCRSVGIYMALVDRIAILGSRVSRTPSYHGTRIQGTANSIVSNNQFEDSLVYKEALTIRGKTIDNPSVFAGYWSENIVVSDNVVLASDDGGVAMHIGPQARQFSERLRNVIFERNYAKGVNALAAEFQVVNDLTIRNNIFVSNYGQTIQLTVGGNLHPTLIDKTPPSSRLYIYNNSINKIGVSNTGYNGIYVTDSTNDGVRDVNGRAKNIFIRNNIAYAAPGNASVSRFLFAPHDVSTTNYVATNNSTDVQVGSMNPFRATNPTVFSDFTPTNYAAASSNADQFVPVWDDFNRKSLNITTPKILGAIQP